MIGLLIDHHPVQTEGFQLGVLFHRQRLDLHMQRGELAANRGQMLTKVVHADLALMFAGHQQQMLKAHFADRRAFTGNFRLIQSLALDAVTH